jgi:assimilatory nitrate reductase catalytic subunit
MEIEAAREVRTTLRRAGEGRRGWRRNSPRGTPTIPRISAGFVPRAQRWSRPSTSTEIHGRRAGWDEALDFVASTFSQTIAEHGPDAVAFYVSGQLLTEDYYAVNKLMKGFIGSVSRRISSGRSPSYFLCTVGAWVRVAVGQLLCPGRLSRETG